MTFYKKVSPFRAGQTIRCCFILILVFLSGCASIKGFPKSTYNEKDEIKALESYHAPAKIEEYVREPDPEKKKSIRDNFVLARMRAMDIRFNLFLQALRQENIPAKTAVSWAKTGVSTAGGLIAGFPSQILSGVAAGLEASQAPVNEHIFYEKTMPVLFGQMEASRKEVKARILTGLSQPISVYPLPKALVDLEDYYLAGSIPGALINISAASGAASSEADKKIAKLVPLTAQQAQQAKVIGEAIRKETDLNKVIKAIQILNQKLNLKPGPVPSNLQEAVNQLAAIWQGSPDTPENIGIFYEALQEGGIILK